MSGGKVRDVNAVLLLLCVTMNMLKTPGVLSVVTDCHVIFVIIVLSSILLSYDCWRATD